MVSLVVGFPGSGKSYYVIDKIVNILDGKDKISKDIDVIYTNINGVKFDQFPKSKIEFKKLNIDDLYTYLTESHALYEQHKNGDNVDDHLIKHSKEKGFYKAYIVFDECHDFFTPQDKVKIYWLTYHRHLHHEIVMLTQNKTLIHSKYRAIPEIFIEAQPRSKKLFSKTLTYKSYASFAMRKADMFDKFNVKTSQEVFSLYQSGNKSNQKSILIKFLIIIGIGLIIAGFLFWYVLNSFTAPTEKEIKQEIIPTVKTNNINTAKSEPNDQQKTHDVEVIENHVITMMCDTFKGCIYENNTYPISYINKFIALTKSKKLNMSYIYFDKNSKHRVFKYLILTNDKKLSSYFLITKKVKTKKSNKINIGSITDKVQL